MFLHPQPLQVILKFYLFTKRFVQPQPSFKVFILSLNLNTSSTLSRNKFTLERTGFVYRCENCDRHDFKGVLRLVKSFALLIWDTRKNELYGDQDNETSLCSCSDWRSYNCVYVGAWSMAYVLQQRHEYVNTYLHYISCS